MALNAPVMLLVFAIVPLDTVLGGANVLSILAEMVYSCVSQDQDTVQLTLLLRRRWEDGCEYA